MAALDKPAFTAAPGELLAAGRAAPAGDWSVTVLREQTDTSYDDRGRCTQSWRFVFVVQAEDAVEGWRAIHASWRPFYQGKPVVRARVVDPSGSVAELDPTSITEEPIRRDAGAESNRRHLRATLPRLRVGAVVEQEIARVDHDPSMAAGDAGDLSIGSSVPTLSTVLSFAAPASTKARVVVRQLPAGTRAEHQVVQGRERWLYQVPAQAAVEPFELGVPSDVTRGPYVGLTTAASWTAVARGHRALVDPQIAAGPVSWPAELPRGKTLEAVQSLVRWLHGRVRLTGVDLSDSTYTPSPPSETLARGSGSDLDVATALVALLRQTGMRAELALVHGGPGRDIDPDLVGLGRFDFVLVRARPEPSGPDVWVDPGDELVRAGELSERGQGRRALVISDDVRGLITTPAASSAVNVAHEIRTFTIPESGAAIVSVLHRGTGVFERGMRRSQRNARAGRKGDWAEYFEREYGATLDQVSSSDPLDVATPFELTVTAKGTNVVTAARDQISIDLSRRTVLGHLSSTVNTPPSQPRIRDFEFSAPHVYEIENRFVVPEGFTLPADVPEHRRAIATAVFTERRWLSGRTLNIAFRFETGKPRLTPAELTALQVAVHELSKEEIHLKLEHTGLALSEAGKPREAIAECERLVAFHPAEALHHLQLATALLRAGAGEAARREARKASAIEPASGEAQLMLGWVLEHDTLGRQFADGWDRIGAIAALRKAMALSPTDSGAAAELADVLQRDAFGQAFEQPIEVAAGAGTKAQRPSVAAADLPGAIAAWRVALAAEKSDDHALGLAEALLWAGQHTEAEAVARGSAASERRDKLVVAAVAAHAGGKAALAAASDLRTGASRIALINQVGSLLMMQRRYELARELLAETGALVRLNKATSQLTSQLTRHPPVSAGTRDPEAAVSDVLLAGVDPYRTTPVFWDREIEHRVRRPMLWAIPPGVRSFTTTAMLGDLARSIATVQLDGEAGLWRANVDDGGTKTGMYLVLDRGTVKLIATSDQLSGAGRYLLRTLDALGEVRARKLLDWIRGDADKLSSRSAQLFKKLWGPGIPPSRDAILLAAAALAGGSDADLVIAIATRCASTLPEAELLCHELLVDGYMKVERWADAAAHLDAMMAAAPARAGELLVMRAMMLGELGRTAEAYTLIDEAVAKNPGFKGALFVKFRVAVSSGAIADAVSHSEALARQAGASVEELNGAAWYRLTVGTDLSAALEIARKATAIGTPGTGIINTQAAIEAELGELGAALEDNARAIALRPGRVLDDADRYVAARIIEQLGLTGDAAAIYKRIARTDHSRESVYALAQKRLAALAKSH